MRSAHGTRCSSTRLLLPPQVVARRPTGSSTFALRLMCPDIIARSARPSGRSDPSRCEARQPPRLRAHLIEGETRASRIRRRGSDPPCGPLAAAQRPGVCPKTSSATPAPNRRFASSWLSARCVGPWIEDADAATPCAISSGLRPLASRTRTCSSASVTSPSCIWTKLRRSGITKRARCASNQAATAASSISSGTSCPSRIIVIF